MRPRTIPADAALYGGAGALQRRHGPVCRLHPQRKRIAAAPPTPPAVGLAGKAVDGGGVGVFLLADAARVAPSAPRRF